MTFEAREAPNRWSAPLRRVLGRVLSRGGRHRRTHVTSVEGLPLIVLADVFDPVAFRSGALLAWAVRAELAGTSNLRVLDLGTGSGVGAVFAARAGASVVATDIHPPAVRCARANAALHDLEIDSREGDLFAPVAGERFDLVLFNPPFYRGRPAGGWDRAWRGEGVLERFAEGLAGALAPGGAALLSLSTDGACGELLSDLDRRGYALEPVVERRFVGEIATVWRARAPRGTAG